MAVLRAHDGSPGAARRRDPAQEAGHGLLLHDDLHAEAIRSSHERSAALGLRRIDQPDYQPLAAADLAVMRERNHRLYVHAVPVMELLREQIMATQSMVVLVDAHGVVLHSVGDADFLDRAAQVALIPGVDWSERSKGTNALGTALVSEEPIVVHADEHFLHANAFLTCSAAPIFDPRGNVLGVLDVTGDHRSYHNHTMGLVKMSARMIENHWLSDDYRHALRLHFHNRAEFIDTLLEGIVAIGHDGKLVGANRAALDQLGMSAAAVRMNPVEALFGLPLSAMLDHFRSAAAQPLLLSLGNGLRVHLQLRVGAAARQLAAGKAVRGMRFGPDATPDAAAGTTPLGAMATVATAATPATPPRARAGALAALRTGDAGIDAVVDKVSRIVDRGIGLLIAGEPGVGKQQLAHAVHQDSQRAAGPFVAVDCALLPPQALQAELFGQAGAGGLQPGRVQQAEHGTLFLAHVEALPAPQQAQLLRLLVEQRVTPQGAAASQAVDVAVVAAHGGDLRERVARHEFRDDLYLRLNGLAVRLPPLRERSDLLVLARRMLAAACGATPPLLDTEVQGLLLRHDWPGNLHQLEAVLRTAAALAGGEALVRREHLSDDFLADLQAAPAPSLHANTAAAPLPHEGAGTLQALELSTIERVVRERGGNISLASKQLGISRNTIYRKLAKR